MSLRAAQVASDKVLGHGERSGRAVTITLTQPAGLIMLDTSHMEMTLPQVSRLAMRLDL